MKIFQKILRVHGETIAKRGRFGGLEVREGDDGRVRILLDEFGEADEEFGKRGENEIKRGADAQRVGVVFDVHRGRAEVDDPPADGTLLRKGFDLGHQVVVNFRFDGERAFDIHFIGMVAQAFDLRRSDEAKLGLSLRQRDPDATPESPLVFFAPQAAHLVTAVAPGEGGEVGGERHW